MIKADEFKKLVPEIVAALEGYSSKPGPACEEPVTYIECGSCGVRVSSGVPLNTAMCASVLCPECADVAMNCILSLEHKYAFDEGFKASTNLVRQYEFSSPLSCDNARDAIVRELEFRAAQSVTKNKTDDVHTGT